MTRPIAVLLLFIFAFFNSMFAQPVDSLAKQLKSAQEQVAMVNAIFRPPAQYIQIPKTRWGYWGLGNFEEAAFIKNDIVVAVYSTSWFAAPPVFMRSPDYDPAAWVSTMNNRFDSIAGCNTDPGLTCMSVAPGELRKINADRGYIFNKNPDSSTPYRSVYRQAKLLFLQKDDLGRILVAYYYHPKDENNVRKEIRKQWGMITFKEDKSFYQDQSHTVGQKTIYLGRFAYANTPEEKQTDSLHFEKRKQQLQKSGPQR